ncbi:MAG: peptidoglycan DD-metalloendopeptidase family protein [Candidatus Peribacteraceae bacterium]|nr:peptidoglycan DD-metalloendopeptidase family protein [Candidatus Peribacteraceae bacterium]
MHIRIHISRPWATLAVLISIVGFMVWTVKTVPPASSGRLEASTGGAAQGAQQEIRDAEEGVRQARQQDAVLERKEEILRFQLRALEQEQELLREREDPDLQRAFAEARDRLVELLKNRRAAEQELLASLTQVWEAELRGGRISAALRGPVASLIWPVEPLLGLSARFMDAAYEERFGLSHYAIDIPVEQNSVVRAPADGEVMEVADNGLGYSYLILSHQGVATLYGHVSSFLVQEGQTVRRGDPIALSGGRPGSKGAGSLSTGPHLHFETIVNGAHVDPLTLLPPWRYEAE